MMLAERRDAEIARDIVETVAQGLWHRHAVRFALHHFSVALLARQPDALDARQPPRAADVADYLIDRALEVGRRHEGLDRDRGNRLPGIGGFAGFLDEIDDVAAKRRAIKCAGKEPDDEAQAVALVIADREEVA